MSMEYYTQTQPTLISDKTANYFNQTIYKLNTSNQSIFRKIFDNIIYPNLGSIILLLAILIFLYYRYRSNNEHFGGMDSPKERIARPTLNPYYPVSEQKSYVNYTPDQIPVYIDGNLVNNIQYEDGQYDTVKLQPHPPTSDNVLASEPEAGEQVQYAGPYYHGLSNDVSDDMNLNFVKASQENLNEFDTLLKHKVQMDSPFAVCGVIDD